jgi:hypothetical protein
MAAAEVLQNHSRASVHQQYKVFDNLLLLLFRQVDEQDVPITGQPSKRQSKKKKKQNDQTTKQSLRISRTIPTHTKQLNFVQREIGRF